MPLTYDMRDAAAPLAGLEVTQTDMLRLHTGHDRGEGVEVKHFLFGDFSFYRNDSFILMPVFCKGAKRSEARRQDGYWFVNPCPVVHSWKL